MKKIILILFVFIVGCESSLNCDAEIAEINTKFDSQLISAAEQGNENQIRIIQNQRNNALMKACD